MPRTYSNFCVCMTRGQEMVHTAAPRSHRWRLRVCPVLPMIPWLVSRCIRNRREVFGAREWLLVLRWRLEKIACHLGASSGFQTDGSSGSENVNSTCDCLRRCGWEVMKYLSSSYITFYMRFCELTGVFSLSVIVFTFNHISFQVFCLFVWVVRVCGEMRRTSDGLCYFVSQEPCIP